MFIAGSQSVHDKNNNSKEKQENKEQGKTVLVGFSFGVYTVYAALLSDH